MPAPTIRQRCFNHGERAAVARCAVCGRHFCRECVAEHDGRMTCGACLRASTTSHVDARRWMGRAFRAVHTVVAFFTVWVVFHWLAALLARVPTPMHEGTVWTQGTDAEDESP